MGTIFRSPAVSPSASLRLALTAFRLHRGHSGAQCIVQFESAARDRETLLHPRVVLGEITHDAAILERQAVGIFEIDRLSPSVVDDVGGLDAPGAQFVALGGESSRRAGLERKMIEAG